MLESILATVALGFFIGGLGRFCVPGPDPMPVWLTILIGLLGSAVGYSFSRSVFGEKNEFAGLGHYRGVFLLEVAVASLLVVAYRRFVQDRPIRGPEAYRFPTKGYGIERIRGQLVRRGIDPDKIAAPGVRLITVTRTKKRPPEPPGEDEQPPQDEDGGDSSGPTPRG